MADLTVAKTILEQLGAGRFIAMTGSKNFSGSENALTFKVGSNPKGVTHFRITLTPMDAYKLDAYKIRGTRGQEPVETREWVYSDNLQEVFTCMTGLCTSMGTMGRSR